MSTPDSPRSTVDLTPMSIPPVAVPENYRNGARPSWHQLRRHRTVISLLRGLKGRVLDYGCGYGDLTHAMSRSHEVVGCDVDAQRVEFARNEYSTLEFSVCATGRTPFADQSFDIVVSAVVIHFVPEPEAYLREVKRILKPGGHLLIVCRNQAVVRNALRQLIGKPPEGSRLWLPSRAEMKSLLEARGFEHTATNYFYDPPFVGWKNLGDWVVGSIEQLFAVLGIKGPAGYYAHLTRCREQ